MKLFYRSLIFLINFSLATCAFANEVCSSAQDIIQGCYVYADTGYISPLEVAPQQGQVGRVRVTLERGAQSTVPASVALSRKLAYFVAPYLVGQPNFQNSQSPILWGDYEDVFGRSGGMIPQELIDSLNRAGVDVLVFDYLEEDVNGNYLVSKSLALQKAIRLIEQINRESQYDSLLFGFSLGGVIARHALVSLEGVDYEHKISTYVSWDSPHLGAHVPLAIQATPKFAEDALYNAGTASFPFTLIVVLCLSICMVACGGQKAALEASEQISEIRQELLGSPAARELLIQNINNNDDGRYVRDPLSTHLIGELERMGFPERSTNIAFFGGSYGEKNQRWKTQDKYFNLVTDTNQSNSSSWEFFGYVANGLNPHFIDASFNHPQVPYSRKKSLIGDSLDTAMCSQMLLPIPFAEGLVSYFEGQGHFMDTELHADILNAHEYAKTNCFVPTVSALAADTLDINLDPKSGDIPDNSVITDYSPFDEIYYPGVSEDKDYIHFSVDYWEEADEIGGFQDRVQNLIASTYGAGISCLLDENNTRAENGGYGIHNLVVKNDGDISIGGWNVKLTFGQGQPAVGWFYGVSEVVKVNGGLLLSGRDQLEPGDVVRIGLGGSYSGPNTGVEIKCN